MDTYSFLTKLERLIAEKRKPEKGSFGYLFSEEEKVAIEELRPVLASIRVMDTSQEIRNTAIQMQKMVELAIATKFDPKQIDMLNLLCLAAIASIALEVKNEAST